MANESILGMMFETGADPSKAFLATEEFRTKATKALAEFERGTRQEYDDGRQEQYQQQLLAI